jgi:hypothetical protein
MKPAVIELRPAEFSDYKTIAALHADNWRKYYRGILSDHFLDHEVEGDRLDTWHKRLSAPRGNQIITIALLENTIAGFSCLYLDEDPIFGSFMDNLHVSSHLQQSGIGKILLIDSAKTICDKAVNKKCTCMYMLLTETLKFFMKEWEE